MLLSCCVSLLNLYRRHYRVKGQCSAGHILDSRTYETDELRRGWKKCDCPIYAAGTLGGRFSRKNTRQKSWREARFIAEQWELAECWGERKSLDDSKPSPAVSNPPGVPPISVEEAIGAFLEEHRRHSAFNTQRKCRTIMNKLSAYSNAYGYMTLAQWGPVEVRAFRDSWDVSPATAGKNMSIVKSFFELALNNEWISRNPAKLVRPSRARREARDGERERTPFSDEELRQMFYACENLYGKVPIRWSKISHCRSADTGHLAAYRYRWTGEDLADFIAVSVYTGLRISDVCTFNTVRLKSTGECHIRTTKTGSRVYTYIPEWLQQRIRSRETRYGQLIFGSHNTTNLNVITDLWRRKLKRLWKLCGPWSEIPTPHRFRHTFARILLQRPGVSVRDVAELLGNSESMVRKHYAAWVLERQERLTHILKDAFSDKPRPTDNLSG